MNFPHNKLSRMKCVLERAFYNKIFLECFLFFLLDAAATMIMAAVIWCIKQEANRIIVRVNVQKQGLQEVISKM